MHAQQVFEIGQDLAHRNWRVGLGAAFEESEVTARDIKAVDDLMIDAVDILTERSKRCHIEAMRADQIMSHLIEITADHCERAVDVVQNACVNFGVGARQFFAELAIVNLAL